MKYTVNTELKVITFEGLITCVEVKELCDKYPDYSFQLRGIPDSVFLPFSQTGYIDIKDNNDSIEHSKFKVSDYPFSTSGTVTTNGSNTAASSGTFVANYPKTYNN